MTRSNQLWARRSGVTLIELLVVATIMLTLAAVSVPTIKPMMESQTTSHAAQIVSTYLERAKAHASTTGRSCGVVFEYFQGTYNENPDDPQGSASLVLRQVEEQPDFSGDFGTTASLGPDFCLDLPLGSPYLVCDQEGKYRGRPVNRLFPQPDGSSVSIPPYYLADATLYNGPPPRTWLDEYFETHDEVCVQFNSTGQYYPLVKISRRHFYNGAYYNEGDLFPPGAPDAYRVGGTYYVVKPSDAELPAFDLATVKLRGRGAPVARMAAPVGLSQGTVVDLEFSGRESDFFTKGADVTVMFSPTGDVDYIIQGGQREIPAETLYFLIGRWDRISALGVAKDDAGNPIGTLAEDGLWNFEDGANFWVAINPQTGTISTAEVNQPFAYAIGDLDEGVYESREFARFSKRNIGGR